MLKISSMQLKNGDGYIFSKSVKMLPETEKTWVLLPNNYRDVKNAAGETLYRIKECVDEFEYKFTESETGSLKKFQDHRKKDCYFQSKTCQKTDLRN